MGENPAGSMNDKRVPHTGQTAPITHRSPPRRLAVLVDTENVSPAHPPRIVAAAMKHGSVEIRRAFGAVAASGWGKALVSHAFHTVAGAPQPAGRNAADIELTIAAMDLLHDTRIDGYVLASSDSDFAPLTNRLTGGAVLTWWVVPIMLAAGFVTPLPYNYWRLKALGKACH